MKAVNNLPVLPLYAFFEQLRKNGFPLGTRDYTRLIDALQSGFGYEPTKGVFLKKNLLHLCKLLWLKPQQSVHQFETLFEETYPLEFRFTVADKTDADKQSEPPEQPEVKDTSSPQTQDTSSEQAQKDEKEKQKENPKEPSPLPKNLQNTVEELTVWVKIGAGTATDGDEANTSLGKNAVETRQFLFTPHYYPLERRKTQQNFRTLPLQKKGRRTKEIDVNATITNTIEKGGFTEFQYLKQKTNGHNLILFIDHQGSMVAFHPLAEILKTEIKKNFPDKNKAFQAFYFYNLPQKYLYKNPQHTEYESKCNFFQSLSVHNTLALILSDAGAARGSYRSGRLKATNAFLDEIQKVTHKIAWLNPMPQYRWKDTTAEAIEQKVAMFEADEKGLYYALQYLKGKSSRR